MILGRENTTVPIVLDVLGLIVIRNSSSQIGMSELAYILTL